MTIARQKAKPTLVWSAEHQAKAEQFALRVRDAFDRMWTGALEDIPGQESAKRAIEVAATGYHPLQLFGTGIEHDRLRAAYARLCVVELPVAAVVVRAERVTLADLALPPPTETEAEIAVRIEAARARLNFVATLGMDTEAVRFLDRACNEYGFDRVAAEQVARSVAALDDYGYVGRRQIAEALSYLGSAVP